MSPEDMRPGQRLYEGLKVLDGYPDGLHTYLMTWRETIEVPMPHGLRDADMARLRELGWSEHDGNLSFPT